MSNISFFDGWLSESITSDADLDRMANIIITESINRFLKYYDKKYEDYKEVSENKEIYNSYEFVWFLVPVLIKYEDYKYSKKFSKEFLQCLKKSKYIRVSYLEKTKNTLGDYDNDYQINIYVDVKDTRYTEERKRIIESPTTYGLNTFFNQYKSVLIHELQHYIDRWRSEFKYVDKEKEKYNSIDNVIPFDKYLNLSHEISARYTQTLSELTSRGGYKDFQELLNHFKIAFKGWYILSDETKKRIIKRLSQYFNSIKKDKLKVSEDKMKAILLSIENKYDVYVKFSNNKFIEIFDSNIENLDYKNIFPELIKISNIYRYDITVYAVSNEFKEYLKSVDFKQNKGKNIRFDIRANWYYESKRS